MVMDRADWTALGLLLDGWAQAQGGLWALKNGADGRYIALSDGMRRLFGSAAAGLVGSLDADLLDASLATALRSADQTALAHDGTLSSNHRFEWQGVRHDYLVWRRVHEVSGQRLIASLWLDQAPARQREAQLKTALEQLEQHQRASEALRRELRDQGLHDLQSGLYTLAHFEDQLRREVDLSAREHREFAVVYMEFDPFSPTIRSLGSKAQDRVLEAMGRLIRSNTRAMDASCRMDDRRFAVLLSGVGLATAHSRMEGLRRQCATQIVMLEGQEMGFSVSMGVSSYPHTAHTQGEVLAACESALTEARRRGGNSIALASIKFDPA